MTSRKILRWRVGLGAVAVFGLFVAPGAVRAGGVRMKAPLAATTADVDAKGQAGLGVRGADGVFDVKTSRLDRSAAYDVIVGGVKVGTLPTTRGGSGHLRFRSRPRAKEHVLGFDPRGKVVSVRNAAGKDVLVGAFPDDGTDPTATACCVPDDQGGAECEDVTPDACTAAGGTSTQAASCMPDPCATMPPAAATVCCTNETGDDGSETECEDEDSAADCTAGGGTVVEATSCDANPCAPATPPSGDVVACCVPDDEGSECEERTTEACVAESGTAMAGATCDANPCGVGSRSNDGNDGEGHDGDGGEEGADD